MKIVSLLPAATEILCDMGLAEYISAVSHECDYPSAVKNKIKITSSIIPNNTNQNAINKLVKEAVKNNIPLYAVDNEQLNTINPDLIITQGLCDVCSISEDKIQATLKNNLCTLSSSTEVISLNGITFEEICQDILAIGKAVKKEEIARKMIKEAILTKYKITKEKNRGSLLLLEWIDPYFSAGHWIPEQIEMAGFISSIGKKGEKSKQISAEEIIKKNPDYIGLICCGYNLEENILFSQKIFQDERINHLSAIKEERVFAFDSNSYFSRPSLRILEGVKQLKKAILQNDRSFHCKRL
ncbi:ABC transporter substrate-binding protein [Candidatus Levibacter sp. Uisw_134_01]|uniref:ABC transporter substrate-binding protein n=1 Tax=Candidatus Levibacter sp. Uisw_134_01 TaxID=3230999 RepID=UPI003D55A2EA